MWNSLSLAILVYDKLPASLKVLFLGPAAEGPEL